MHEWTSDIVPQDAVFEYSVAKPNFNVHPSNMPSSAIVHAANFDTNLPMMQTEDVNVQSNIYHPNFDTKIRMEQTECFDTKIPMEQTEWWENGNYRYNPGHNQQPENGIGEHTGTSSSFLDAQGHHYFSENGSFYERHDQTGTLHWGVIPEPRYEPYTQVVLSPTWEPIARMLTQPECNNQNGVSGMDAPDLYNPHMYGGYEHRIAYEDGEIYVPDIIDPATGTSQVFFSAPSFNFNGTYSNPHGQTISNHGNNSADSFIDNSCDTDVTNLPVPSLLYYEDARGQVSSLSDILEIQPTVSNMERNNVQLFANVIETELMRIVPHHSSQAPVSQVLPEFSVNPFCAAQLCAPHFEENLPTYSGNLLDDLSIFTNDDRGEINSGISEYFPVDGSDDYIEWSGQR
jgi:hypothetical protein